MRPKGIRRRRIVRFTAAQLPAVAPAGSKLQKEQWALDAVVGMIREAGEKESDVVLFGEYANLFHRSTSAKKEDYRADEIPGPFVHAVAENARKYRVNVAIPLFGRLNGETSSFVVYLDRSGTIAGWYQKTHPTIAERKLGMVPGNELNIVELDFGRIGTMTCMDIEYPEVAQTLMLRGAEVLFFPHVQAGWGEVDWELRYRTRAVDTGLPVVSACYGYPEGEWRPGKMLGRSGVIARDGGILGDLGRSIGTITCEVDLAVGRRTEFYFPAQLERTLAVKASRRPELYVDLTNPGHKKKAEKIVRKMLKRKRKE
jgi:predicted amidohydrolase